VRAHLAGSIDGSLEIRRPVAEVQHCNTNSTEEG
jgi:hypothetical protein